MFQRGFSQHLSLPMVLRWASLSFLSGSVNAGGFLAVQRFVTHITGFATLFGADVAMGQFGDALAIISVPIYFIGGAMLSSFFIDRRLMIGKLPRYGLVMGLVALCLGLVGLAGSLEALGNFGSDMVLSKDYFLLATLALASGLQNAAITTASNGVVRTTHMTGLATDVGISVVRAAFAGHDEQRRKAELRNLRLRMTSIAAFVAGSVVGAWLFLKVQYHGFFLPAAIAVYIAFQAVAPERQLERAKTPSLS